jgi:hypothetical protein
MKKTELKTLIREAYKEILNEVSSKYKKGDLVWVKGTGKKGLTGLITSDKFVDKDGDDGYDVYYRGWNGSTYHEPENELEPIENELDNAYDNGDLDAYKNISRTLGIKLSKDYESMYEESMYDIGDKSMNYTESSDKIKFANLIKDVLAEAATPWGKSDNQYNIQSGVIWYDTPGHGGLYVSTGVATKKLTPQAIECGDQYGSGYWYEEDLACNIPFYEQPTWYTIFKKLAGGSSRSKEDIKKTIEEYLPEYFDEDFIAKANKKFGNAKTFPTISIKDTIYTKGFVMDKFVVIETPTPTTYIVSAAGIRYKMSKASMKSHVIEVIRDDKSIWKL